MTHDAWHMTCDTWHITHDTWHMKQDKGQKTQDTRHVTHDTWHMTHDTWHMAHGTWHMAHGTWHMAHDTWQFFPLSMQSSPYFPLSAVIFDEKVCCFISRFCYIPILLCKIAENSAIWQPCSAFDNLGTTARPGTPPPFLLSAFRSNVERGRGGWGRVNSLRETRSKWKPSLLKCGLVENFMVKLKTDRAPNFTDRRIVEL